MPQQRYPKSFHNLVKWLCLYLAAPLYDVPLLGLSLSSLLIYLLVLQLLWKFGGLHLGRLGKLPGLLTLIWFGQLLSLTYNQFFGYQQPEVSIGLVKLLRYAYWFLVACVSAQIFMDTALAKRAARMFGYGCLLSAILVLIEYLLFGGLESSGWSKLTTLSQNSYAWQFSAFMPFVLYLVTISSVRLRPWAIAGFVTVLIAVVINASRSSWGTVTLGLALYSLLWAMSLERKSKAFKGGIMICLLLMLTAGTLAVFPDEMLSKARSRPVTIEDIERDKSWQVRVLMVQKGKKLFLESPVFGFGPGQFRYSEAVLKLPARLAYGKHDRFNRKSAHNSYIQLLAEGGLLLAVPFGLLLLWLIKGGWRATRRLVRAGETWAIPVYVSFICFSVHFWTLSGITSTAPWCLYGLLVAVILRNRQNLRKSQHHRLNKEV